MEREKTLVTLQHSPVDKTLEEIHTDLMTRLSQDVTEERLASLKVSLAASSKLGQSSLEGIGSFALLWEALLKNDLIAVGKYGVLAELFQALEIRDLLNAVQDAERGIGDIRIREESREKTPEPEEICSMCLYQDDEKRTLAKFRCTKCEKMALLCGPCSTDHGQGLKHSEFIVPLHPERVVEVHRKDDLVIEDLLGLPEFYLPKQRLFDHASHMFQLAFPPKPKCLFAHSVSVTQDIGLWRHLVLARCRGSLGDQADTLMAFSFDGKSVYINQKDLAFDSAHLVSTGAGEFYVLRHQEPNVRILDTAAKSVIRDIYVQMPLEKTWTVDACGKIVYIIHGEPTSLVALDMTGKVLTSLPMGYQGFVVCDKQRPRVFVLSQTNISMYEWRNSRLQEVKSGTHGIRGFEIWDVCFRDEMFVVGLSTKGEAPWEVMAFQVVFNDSGDWSMRSIPLQKNGETVIKSFCSPKLSVCKNRLMLGYKNPVRHYRADVFELAVVEDKTKHAS